MFRTQGDAGRRRLPIPPPLVPNDIPSIRLISATPSSIVVSSSEGGNSTTSYTRVLEDSWDTAAATKGLLWRSRPRFLKHRTRSKRLGKSVWYPRNLSCGYFSSTPFTSSSHSSTSANTSFSDVVRRIGGPRSFFGVFVGSQRRVRDIHRPSGRP